MLRRLSKLYHSINRLERIDHAVDRLPEIAEWVSRKPWLMSPVERYLYLMAINNHDCLFDATIEEWETKRITKVLNIYGTEYFSRKKVLELGAGHGNIGAFLADLGADVLCLDGRLANMNIAKLKHRHVKGLTYELCDLDGEFLHYGHFDLIVNFGLIYHLRNVDEHMNTCFSMADDILLESVVCDSNDEAEIFFFDEESGIQLNALDGTACRPSPPYIERLAREHSFEVARFFDADLNSGKKLLYDWESRNDKRLGEGVKLRRFWRLTRAESGPERS